MSAASQDKRFRGIAPLGRGGTAEVARVSVSDLGRDLALKYPLTVPTNDPGEFARLARREYELIGGHRWPGLVRLIEPPHTDPDYLLLELCDGPTLDTVGRVDDLPKALCLLSAVAVSLEYLRARGLIHGDLKSNNIFLPKSWNAVSPDRLWYAKISDFSLGRMIHEAESSRAGLGTVGYMAPEVISQKTTSHQSDLFAFGVIAYQVLTGVHPFLSDDCEPVKVNGRIQEEAVTPVERYRPELTTHPIVPLINKLLAKNPAERPATAYDVCCQLELIGSTYPFRRAIRPRHLRAQKSSYEEILDTLTNLSESDKAQIHRFAGEDAGQLARLIAGNWAVGSLEYVAGKYQIANGVKWPAFLRNTHLARFSRLSWGERKLRVGKAATLDQSAVEPGDAPQLTILLYLLKAATIRRLSAKAAPGAEAAEDQYRATMLWLQAGNLEGAERCAMQAATGLAREDKRREALELLNGVIGYARMTSRLYDVSELMLQAGTILKDSGDTASAEAVYRELIAVLESRPITKTLGIVYNKLGDLYKMRSDFQSGLTALERALTIFEKSGEELEYSHTCNNLGNIYWVIGDLTNSARQYRHALRLQRRLNSSADIASTLSNLGGILCMSGHIRRGRLLLEISLKLKREIGNAGEIARTLNNLGYVSYMTGDHAQAVDYLSESLVMNRRVGSRKEILINIENLTSIMISAGQIGKSLSLLRDGLVLADEIGDQTQKLLLQLSLAGALIRLGQAGDAKQILAQIEAGFVSVDDPAIRVVHHCANAHLHLLLGRPQQAAGSVQEARGLAGSDISLKLPASLLLARLEEIPGLDEEIVELIENSQLHRMTLIHRFNVAERLLGDGNPAGALARISDDLRVVLSLTDDVEIPRLCLIAAETLHALKRTAEAAPFCQKARSTAGRYGTLSDLFLCGVTGGKVAFALGDYEAAFREYRFAIQTAKEIAGSLTDPDDRNDFQRRPEITFVLSEIERLGLTLGQKKAGRSEPARA